MPHTHSRYQQDLPFIDGLINYSASDFIGLASAGTAPALTRNAVGDLTLLVAASSTATLSCDLLSKAVRRTGYHEDTQNLFGSTFGGGIGGAAAGPSGVAGTGIPASAEFQGRPGNMILPGQPQPASGMATLQEITPRTALKIKGIKPLSLTVVYSVLTGAATSLTCVLTQSAFTNGVAITKTALLASAANGLTNVSAATPYVTTIQIPNAVYFQITPNVQLWFEIACQEPAANTFGLYMVSMACEFNYN